MGSAYSQEKRRASRARQEKNILDFVKFQDTLASTQWTIFSEELIAYRLLMGVPAGTIDPEVKAYVWEIDAENVPVVYHQSPGGAMAGLHRTDQADAKNAGLALKTPEQLITSMKERMDKIKTAYGVSEELWHRWQKWLADKSLWPGASFTLEIKCYNWNEKCAQQSRSSSFHRNYGLKNTITKKLTKMASDNLDLTS